MRRTAIAAAAPAGRAVRVLPGFAAMICGIAGTWMLAGIGWALIVAAVFLLLLDSKVPPAGAA